MAAYYKVEVTLNSQAVQVGLPSPQSVRVTLPLVGPQGPSGAAGATGAVGPQGPQGVPGTGLEVLTTQGDILYQGAAVGERLPIGTSGQVLKVANGIPAWGNESGAVTSVNGQTGAVTLAAADISDFTTAAAAAAPVQSVNGNTGTVTVAVPSASTATPQALGVAAAGTSADFARADHVHALPTAADIGAAADDDARLSDTRDPNAHAHTAADIDSEEADAGYVLTADGDGGASWEEAAGGNPFDQDLNTADDVTFNSATIDSGILFSGGNQLQFKYSGDPNSNPELFVALHDQEDDTRIGYALLGVRGSENGAGFLQAQNADFRIEQNGGALANLNMANAKLVDADGSSLDGPYTATINVQGELSNDVTLTIPDQSGTLAVTSDIPDPSTATPQALGTAAAGTSDDYSRADHIHAAPALNDLSNVSSAAPSDNDVLVFDTATGNWVAEAPSGGGGASIMQSIAVGFVLN